MPPPATISPPYTEHDAPRSTLDVIAGQVANERGAAARAAETARHAVSMRRLAFGARPMRGDDESEMRRDWPSARYTDALLMTPCRIYFVTARTAAFTYDWLAATRGLALADEGGALALALRAAAGGD